MRDSSMREPEKATEDTRDEELLRRREEARLIMEGMEDIAARRTSDAFAAIARVRRKYGV